MPRALYWQDLVRPPRFVDLEEIDKQESKLQSDVYPVVRRLQVLPPYNNMRLLSIQEKLKEQDRQQVTRSPFGPDHHTSTASSVDPEGQ